MIVKQGEIILSASPYIAVLFKKNKGILCDMCFKKKELKRCKVCMTEKYCSLDCQKIAWKSVHKYECRLLRDHSHDLSDATRFLARLLIRLKNDPSNYSETICEGRTRKFSDLENHVDELRVRLKTDEKYSREFTLIAENLEKFLGRDYMVDDLDNLLALQGAVNVNSFMVSDENLKFVGYALYLTASIFDHSCRPNAVASFNGSKVTVRAIEKLENFRYEDVRINYVDLLNTKVDRQKSLMEVYYFECSCTRCEDPTEAALENSVKCGGLGCNENVTILDDVEVKCPICDYPFSDDYIHEYNEMVTTCKDIVKRTCTDQESVSLRECKVLLGIQKYLRCTDNNMWKVKALDNAFDSAIREDEFDEAYKYGLDAVWGFRHYHGINHPTYGYFLAKLGKVAVLIEEEEKALKLLQAALEKLTISEGADHIITENVKELLPSS